MRKSIIIIFSALIVVSLMFATVSCGSESFDYYIFEDLAECEAIENSNRNDANFEKYNPEEKDNNLKGLKYEEAFCGKFSCEDFEFEIFAYEFSNSADAKQYYINDTGKTQDKSTTFCESWGISNGDMIVLDEEMVYRIEAKTKDSDEIQAFLSEIFSKKLEF